MDPLALSPAALLDLVADRISAGARVLAGGAGTAAAAEAAGLVVVGLGVDGVEAGTGPVDAVLLLAGELAAAGERAPAVLDRATRRCRPGGWIAAAVPSATHSQLTGAVAPGGVPAIGSADLSHMLAERGLDIGLLAAPGAAAALAGRAWGGTADLDLDRTSGLLDAAPTILALARTPRSMGERSRTFYSSITRKIVAASVLCRDAEDRILLVFDLFKGAWTLPGGLVDAGESPIGGAVREAREEGGVDVETGQLLGVFGHAHPERVHLVYAARLLRPTPNPVPLHDHEIGEVRWVDRAVAHDLLDAHMRRKLAECLDHPGRTWWW